MTSVYAIVLVKIWSILFMRVSETMTTNTTETMDRYTHYHLINPLEHYNYHAKNYLNFEITRNNCTNTELRELATETIHNRYPEEEWLHVYTDGSVLYPEAGLGGYGGAGVYSKYFSYYMRVGYHVKNFDAEVAGVWIALKKLYNKLKSIKNVVLLIDSNATIRAIASNNTALNPRVYECRQILRSLERLKKSIVLQWIPSHCKIQGNCIAHRLARQATKELEKQSTDSSKLNRATQETMVNVLSNVAVIDIPTNQTRFIVTANETDVIIATRWSCIIIPANWDEVNTTTSMTRFIINTKRVTANVTINRTKLDDRTQYKIHIKKENRANNFTMCEHVTE